MKARLLILFSTLLFNTTIIAQTIWNGPNITFTKSNFANWVQQANQDRINSNVWITRADNQGIFNIAQEVAYIGSGTTGNSPLDTEWAFGTTANLESLTFTTWAVAMGSNPPSKVNMDMVLHLISDDIYIDIKFTSWSVGSLAGGGFSYQRSTDSGLSSEEFSFEKFKILNNPSSSEIKLNFPSSVTSSSVKVFNILGKEVYFIDKYLDPINVSAWEKGIYLIQVKDTKSIQTKKFIKN